MACQAATVSFCAETSARRYHNAEEDDEDEGEEDYTEEEGQDDDKDPSFFLGTNKRVTGQRSARSRPAPRTTSRVILLLQHACRNFAGCF